MRKLVFDQFEFDSFSSEECLEIHVASKKMSPLVEFHSLREFVAASAGADASEKLGSVSPFNEFAGFSPVRDYLKRFANIIVPEPCKWPTFILIEYDLEWDGVFDTPDEFIRYHWSSTA